MNIERHFYASGLHRQGYTVDSAMQNPAIARALKCAALARDRREARDLALQKNTKHNKGASND